MVLTVAMANGIRERFAHAYENQKHADDSVPKGREFVESYVVFTHYVEVSARLNQEQCQPSR